MHRSFLLAFELMEVFFLIDFNETLAQHRIYKEVFFLFNMFLGIDWSMGKNVKVLFEITGMMSLGNLGTSGV